MRLRLVMMIIVLIARRSERKAEYDEIAIHNFAIHLVYVERYPINMIPAHSDILCRRKVTVIFSWRK